MSLVASCFPWSLCALADDAPAAKSADAPVAERAEAPPDLQGGGMEEILVTARRRTESLQDVPVAVTALSTAALERRSLTDAIGLNEFVPNLNATKGLSGGSAANFFIRGVGQVDHVAGVDPGVSLYVDGVYLGRANGADIATLDLDRIEVLRGPQGTLFGKNTLGGAINVFTRQPTDDFSGSVKMIGGGRNLAELRSWVNVPLAGDTLLARFSLDAKTQDGYGYRVYDSHRFGDQHTIAGRGHVLWKAADDLTVDFQGDYTRTRGTANMVKMAGVGTLGFLPPGYGQYVPTQKYETNSNFDPGNTVDVWGTAATATWTLSPRITLKSISAYRHLRQLTGNDYDGGPQSQIDQAQATRQHQFSEELQLSGNAFADALNWVAGGYYYREQVDQAVPLFVYSPTALDQVSEIDINNLSGFGQASLRLTDWLSLTGGARYTHERKQQTSEAFFFSAHDAFYTLGLDELIDTPPSQRALVTQSPTHFDRSWNSFTPKVSLESKLNPDVLAYASWAKGFKSGGFNSREAATSDFVAYDPEQLETYELGLKTELLDHSLRFNLAGFYSRYDNLQLLVLRVSPDGSPQIATQNAARARIYGVEMESQFRPVRAFELDAAVGYMHNKYLQLDAGAASVGVKLSNQLPQAPDWSVNLGAQYDVMLGDEEKLSYRIDYSYKSRFFFFAANNPLDVQKPYSLVNMRFSYDSGKAWNAAVYVTNVFNRYYFYEREDIRTAYDVALDWPAEPRTFGIELGAKF